MKAPAGLDVAPGRTGRRVDLHAANLDYRRPIEALAAAPVLKWRFPARSVAAVELETTL